MNCKLKNIVVFLGAFLLAFNAMAQDVDIVEKMVLKHQEEKKVLTDSIANITTKYKAIIDEKDKQIASLSGNAVELQKKDDELKKKDAEIATLNSRLKAYDGLNDLIYRQCLLFPLERRYNQNLVGQSIDCLQGLGIANNEMYKKVFDAYFPLLQHYKEYNDETVSILTNILNSPQFKSLEMLRKSPEVPSTDAKVEKIKSDYSTALKNTQYYKYYSNKASDAPRITYLSNVLDEFSKLSSTDFTRENIQAIIDKLVPK